VGARKGFSHLQVDGKLLPTAKWPRLDRFIEHNIELPVATLNVSAAREVELRQAGFGIGARARRRACESGPAQRRQRQQRRRASSPPNAPAQLRYGLSELDPRSSPSIEHGWCKSCFGTGLQLEQFDAEQSGEESTWREAGAAKPARASRRRAGRGRAPGRLS